MNELQSATWLLLVVRAGSIGAAARALGVSPSTVSRGIAELEAHLAVTLLARTTRHHHLTAAGEAYLTHAEAMVQARQAAHDAVQAIEGAARGRLRVTMPVALGERLLAEHLPAFRALHPALRLELDLSDRAVALVEEGYDVAIRVGRPADSTLRVVVLGRVPVLLVASPAYLAHRGQPRHPDDLASHDLITIGPVGPTTTWAFHRGDERVVITPRAGVHTSSPVLAAGLATAGQGLLRTLDWLVRDALARGTLVPVMTTWTAHPPGRRGVPIVALYGTAGRPGAAARAFVAFVRQVLGREGQPDDDVDEPVDPSSAMEWSTRKRDRARRPRS